MNSNLRPMNLGEILDRTFQIYRAKFQLFVAIAALPAMLIISLEAANRVWWGLIPNRFSGDISLTVMQWSLYLTGLYQVALLLHLLVWPAFACLTSRIYLGEYPKLTAAVFRGNAPWRSWLWMAIANWGVVLILPELLIGGLTIWVLYLLSEVVKVGADAMDDLASWIIFGAFSLGFLVFFWLSSALFIAVPAKSLEELTVGKALRRSWKLSIGSRWRMIVVRLALVLTSWLTNFLLSAVLLLLLRWAITSFGVLLPYYRNFYTCIGFLAAFAVSILFGPIFPISLTLFYYDQRILHEGYDIERMMDAAGLNAPRTSPSGDGPAPHTEAREGQA